MTEKQPLPEDSLNLSKIFHEIKSPLTLINSSLQFIEADHPEVRDFRFWNQTMRELHNLRLMIDELSSLQKSKQIQKTLINLFDFTEDLLEATESFLLETGTPLTLDCPEDDLDFFADSVKLQHAVVNLIKNAAEASVQGSPILLRIVPKGEMLHILVKDHGCGMSPEQRKKAPEPFHTTKADGTGLGLPVVKGIAEAHGGTLSIESGEGCGTSVCICLPIR